MQQWIPRTQTLEPKIWGQVGLRQGIYIGLGVFAGIFFLIALAPFGLGPRVAGALLALAAGVVAGFMRVKGLSPERYLFHRLRFGLQRPGLGVWQVPKAPQSYVAIDLRPAIKQQEAPPKRAAASTVTQPRRATPAWAASTARWSEYMVEASPFGMRFYLAALGTMAIAVAYVMEFHLP